MIRLATLALISISVGLGCKPAVEPATPSVASLPESASPAGVSRPSEVSEASARVEVIRTLEGGMVRIPPVADTKATVIFFLGADCPISNGYSPEIRRICEEFEPHGFAFLILYADTDLSPEDASRHARDFRYPCQASLDTNLKMARRFGVTIKPEVAVVSPRGETLYRGRIDDVYADFGKRRAAPTVRDLVEALEAIRVGQSVGRPFTSAIGCDIDFSAVK